MTLAEAIDLVLQRVGLEDSETNYEARARRYLNMTAIEIASLPVSWWWLNRTTTFTTVASTRVYTPISGNVTNWYSFVDESNDRPIQIIEADLYDGLDIDRSEEGDVSAVFVAGMDATTGYPVIELWRTPGTTGDTIRIRYQIAISSWSSSNDSSEMMVLGIPQLLENALVYGASALYLEQKGDLEQSARERTNLDNTVRLALKQNINMQGNKKFVADPPGPSDDFVLHYGTSAVVP